MNIHLNQVWTKICDWYANAKPYLTIHTKDLGKDITDLLKFAIIGTPAIILLLSSSEHLYEANTSSIAILFFGTGSLLLLITMFIEFITSQYIRATKK